MRINPPRAIADPKLRGSWIRSSRAVRNISGLRTEAQVHHKETLFDGSL